MSIAQIEDLFIENKIPKLTDTETTQANLKNSLHLLGTRISFTNSSIQEGVEVDISPAIEKLSLHIKKLIGLSAIDGYSSTALNELQLPDGSVQLILTAYVRTPYQNDAFRAIGL